MSCAARVRSPGYYVRSSCTRLGRAARRAAPPVGVKGLGVGFRVRVRARPRLAAPPVGRVRGAPRRRTCATGRRCTGRRMRYQARSRRRRSSSPPPRRYRSRACRRRRRSDRRLVRVGFRVGVRVRVRVRLRVRLRVRVRVRLTPGAQPKVLVALAPG
eukprot:scaffold57542_cov70-Phaeocystis_antarctica.AAC.2